MAVSSLFLGGSLLLSLSSFFSGAVATGTGKYALDKEYSGSTFFEGFKFFTDADPTHGFVEYVDYATAYENGLISIGQDGTAYLGVDSTTIVDPKGGKGRQSVRVQTKELFTQGLFILDASNMPGGVCGTWPAWWSYGPGWPAGGAIDIIEGINTKTTNLISLQTAPNCTISGTFETGTLENTNCDVAATYGVGCGVSANTPNTYGLGFNNNGGGVYATEWTDEYIRVWFFPRESIPADITAGTPTPENWGLPVTNFQGGCDIDSHFFEHNFVLNTDFCGEWAGAVWGSDSECAAKAPTCEEFVGLNPAAFEDMYWAINYIKVFKKSASTSSSSSSVVSSTTTHSSSSSTSSAAVSTTSSSSSIVSTSSTADSSSSSSVVASSTSTAISSSSSEYVTSSSSSYDSTPSSTSSSSEYVPSSTISSEISSSASSSDQGGASSTSSAVSYSASTTPSASSYPVSSSEVSSSTTCTTLTTPSSSYPVSTSLPASSSTKTPCSTTLITTSSTSTVYSTSIYTTGDQVTTELISQYTTVCPITLTSTYPASTPSSVVSYSTNAPIRTSIPSYTTVVVTTYTSLCPTGSTLQVYTTSQTQVIYRPESSLPAYPVQTSAGISMLTTTTSLESGETLTLTVPYTYPSTTTVGKGGEKATGGNVGGYGSVAPVSTAKGYVYPVNGTASAAAGTGKSTPYPSASASSKPILASSGAGRVEGGVLGAVVVLMGLLL